MKNIIQKILIAISITSLASCASIIHGTTQTIGISSSPLNAQITIDKKSMGKTPYFAELDRGSEHVIIIQLNGYKTEKLLITKSISGWTFGNILLGNIIGLGIDLATGGLYELSPEQLNISLKKNSRSAMKSKKGLFIVAVLTPNPDWEKIGNLVQVK